MKKHYRRRTTAAMVAYGEAARQPNEPWETNLTDLLADMLHRYAADPTEMSEYDDPDPDPVSWLENVVRIAVGHYEAERAGII